MVLGEFWDPFFELSASFSILFKHKKICWWFFFEFWLKMWSQEKIPEVSFSFFHILKFLADLDFSINFGIIFDGLWYLFWLTLVLFWHAFWNYFRSIVWGFCICCMFFFWQFVLKYFLDTFWCMSVFFSGFVVVASFLLYRSEKRMKQLERPW